MADEKPLSLKDMIARSGATARTIRFYEEVGLLQPIGRTKGGHRQFAARELEKLQLLGDLRMAGFSLEEIRALLSTRKASSGARAASAEVIQLLEKKIEELKHRLGTLVHLREEFGSSIDVLQRACSSCTHPPNQEVCDVCTQVDHETLPRTFRWIWNVE